MKLKLTLMAVAATLALGYQAQATSYIGVVSNYSRMNVSLTIQTNVYSKVGNVEGDTIHSAKINNTYLLNLFAHWASIERSTSVTWPVGAQLVIGWDSGTWDGDVLVVDKTGTNVLYDATSTSDTSTHYFSISYWDEYGTDKYTDITANPGYYSYTYFNTGSAHLLDNYYLAYTYIWSSYTPATVSYFENWDSHGKYIGWHESEKFNFYGAGSSQYFLDKESPTTSGVISDSGHGKYYVPYFD